MPTMELQTPRGIYRDNIPDALSTEARQAELQRRVTAWELLISKPPICARCGDCCREGAEWQENLTPTEIELLDAMKTENGCPMLDFLDGAALCLIEKILSETKKPIGCRSYFCGEHHLGD